MSFNDITVCTKSTKRANNLRGQDAGLNIGAGGICSYHWAFQDYISLLLAVILGQQTFSKSDAM
jgi:hypothetical protein